MKLSTRSVAFASLALSTFGLLGVGGAAISATGGNFILGRINSADNQSGIVSPVAGKMLLLNNTSTAANATALGLTVRPGHPPMIVNSPVKVPQLNADLLDNFDVTQLATAARTFTDDDTATLRTGDKFWPLPDLEPGNYLVTLATTIIPTIGSAAAPNVAECTIINIVTNEFFAEQAAPYFGGFFAGLSGADTIEVTTANAENLQILCGVQSGTWKLNKPLQVSFIPITSRTETPVVALPKVGASSKCKFS